MKVEYYFFVLSLAIALFGGWGILKHCFGTQEDFNLYLVVKNQENCLEGIIRSLYRYLERQETALQLFLVVEDFYDQTLDIAQRLARRYNFEVLPINDLDEWLEHSYFQESKARSLIDLRGENMGWTEVRKIKRLLGNIKNQTEKN